MEESRSELCDAGDEAVEYVVGNSSSRRLAADIYNHLPSKMATIKLKTGWRSILETQ